MPQPTEQQLTHTFEMAIEDPSFPRILLRNLSSAGWGNEVLSESASGVSPKLESSTCQLMQLFLTAVRTRLAASHALVTLGSQRGDPIFSWYDGFQSTEVAAAWMRDSWSSISPIRESGAPVSLKAKLPRHGAAAPNPAQEEMGSVVAVPVVVKDQSAGILAVAHVPAVDRPEDSVDHLQSAAFVLGITISETSWAEREREMLYSAIQCLTGALDARDAYTRGHSERMTAYALAVANELQEDSGTDSPGGFRDQLRLGALLHDIGKIGIRDHILLKPTSLNDEEMNEVVQHPILGAAILGRSRRLDYVVPSILYHHERHDGSGYPMGLSGEQIPLVARIIGIADAFDAMTSERPYRSAISPSEAIEQIKMWGGTRFDKKVIDAIVGAYEKGILSSVRINPYGSEVRLQEEVSEVERHLPELEDSVPPLPFVIGKLNKMLENPICSASDLSDLLSTDEGLVVKILKMANSAFYALPGRVGSIPLAVTLLGTKTLRGIVIGTAMADITRTLVVSASDAMRLWDHGLAVGVWSRCIARAIEGLDPEEAFTAGLIHDIGKTLALREIVQRHGQLNAQFFEVNDWRVVEKELIGFDHARLGAWAAVKWHLPQALTQAIRCHHDPRLVGDSGTQVARLVWIVHLADTLSYTRVADIEVLRTQTAKYADPAVYQHLPVRDDDVLTRISAEVDEDLGIAGELYAVASPVHQ